MATLPEFSPHRAEPRLEILGVVIDLVDLDRSVGILLNWVRARQRGYVVVTNVHSLVEAQTNAAHRTALNGATLAIADGMPVIWLARARGGCGATRIFGADFMLAVSRALGTEGGSAFYLGGAPGVPDRVAATMARLCPGLRTAGAISPPFHDLDPAEDDALLSRINAARPDVVWVGLGCPKQERWIARNRHRIEAPILAGVGAAFDYHAGRLRRAPHFAQICGLEWIFRLAQDPRRLLGRYLRTNTAFLFYVGRDWLGRKARRA